LNACMASSPRTSNAVPLLALSTAIKYGREGEAKRLISAKADVNERSLHDCTPLILAVLHCAKFEDCGEDLVSELLDAGANLALQTADTLDTALHLAFAQSRDNLVNILLGADVAMEVGEMKNVHGQVPADCGEETDTSDDDDEAEASPSDADQMSLAMEKAATRGGYAETVVTECRRDREERCIRLLEGKADVNLQDKRGYTGLMHAVKNENVGLAQLLLEHKADVTCRTNKKNTAMHFAFEAGHRRMIKLLLEHNASVDKKNSDGKTPAELTTKTHLRSLAASQSPKRRQRRSQRTSQKAQRSSQKGQRSSQKTQRSSQKSSRLSAGGNSTPSRRRRRR